MTSDVQLRWLSAPADLTPALLEALVGCWVRVSDSGGAVGFPHPPVDVPEVRAAALRLRDGLDDDRRLLVAVVGGALAGWLVLHRNTSPLTRHWASLSRVQTDLPYRGLGVGRRLVQEAARAAAADGLEQLHADVRGGQGLEDFYAALGWTEVGRRPRALRLATGDDRDEVLLVLHLPA